MAALSLRVQDLWRGGAACCGACVLFAAAAPPADAQDAVEVSDAIERGIASLLQRITVVEEITYHDLELRPSRRTVSGTVISENRTTLEFRTRQGRTVSIRKKDVLERRGRGAVDEEMNPPNRGGPTALAALALLSARVDLAHPRLSALIQTMSEDTNERAGTYVRALQAAVWASLIERSSSQTGRRTYRRLLRRDLNWLKRAMRTEGDYGYTESHSETPPDNSNTQFAHLGLWAGAVVNEEIPERTWRRMADHWLDSQDAMGGWLYREFAMAPTFSMTVAGCNSLYIVLDQYYARADFDYQLFEGARPNREKRNEIRRIYHALELGDQFLRRSSPDMRTWPGYELFGLERLAAASGLVFIGGQDWFGRYATAVVRRDWGQRDQLIGDAFSLIFLVHGQAPVLFQKLEHGGDAEKWNYYHRDLVSLTRYLGETFERLHRWRRIPVDSDSDALQDAPFLYICGSEPLELPGTTLAAIRRYLDGGGTVILHADRSSGAFTRGARAVFEQLYADRGFKFSRLDKSHPVYHCHFGGASEPWEHVVPLEALDDGSRIVAYLIPSDIAGAWHQQRRNYPDLFRIMANIRVYSAPPYAELPGRLRALQSGPPARSIGTLRLARLKLGERWDAHAGAWERYAGSLKRRTGLELKTDSVEPAALTARGAKIDLLHWTVCGPVELDAADRKAIEDHLSTGGLLLIDAADGREGGVRAVNPLIGQLTVGEKGLIDADDPLLRGTFPGGRALDELEPTRAGSGLSSRDRPPPLILRRMDGRTAVIAAPFDLIAGIDGHFIFDRRGYTPASTARLIDNLLLWRHHQLQTKP